MSDELTNEYIDRILDASKDTKFKLNYSPVDSDQNYQPRFIKSYDLIKEEVHNLKFEDAFKIIDSTDAFQIGDPLHFFKNSRSRLLCSKVVINPFQTEDFIDYFKLMEDDDINYLIRDTSSLAKLRDELPKNLFCFETALKLYQKYSFSTFFYFFTYSL